MGKKMGRPPANINKKLLESLAGLGARRKVIVDALDIDLKNKGEAGCTDSSVARFVKREYGETFGEFLEKRKSILETNLLSKAYSMIGVNAAVTIFFLKNVLGWTDKMEQTVNDVSEHKGITINFADKGDDNAGNVPDSV